MAFFRKIPRAKLYLKLKDLLIIFLKILSSRLKTGEKTKEWEKTLSSYLGFKEVMMLSRARLALFYLLKNLNLAKESEVILTPLTIADIVNSIRWAGLKPVFCDLGENTYNIDYEKLEQTITSKTKAVLITHLAGLASDMDEIQRIVEKHNLILIEDISQALGATFKGKQLGTFGLAGIASLSFLKTCSTLIGGVLGLNDRPLAEKIRQDIKNFPPPPKKLLLKEIVKNVILGLATNKVIFSLFTYYLIAVLNKINPKLADKLTKSNPQPKLLDQPPKKFLHSYTDLQAEMGLKIIKKLQESDKKRIANVRYLMENLNPRAKISLPRLLEDARNVFWRLPIQIEKPEEFKKYLLKNYIDSAQTNLILATKEPAFQEYAAETPEAQKAHKSVFIPIHSSFSKKDMLYIANVINSYFNSDL